MVHTMLSPMLRAESRRPSDFNKTGIGAADQASQDIRSTAACKDSATSMDKEQSISRTAVTLKLPLQLVDENNACIDLSTGDEKAVRLSSLSTSILVFIDWSKKVLEKYDTKYLENLPEVLKYGSTTKKARTEPLSLYTCLEAFLREEPLVPEDMWLVSSFLK